MNETGLDELGLSARASRVLQRADIWTLEQLMNTEISQLAMIRGMGKKTLKEILQKSGRDQEPSPDGASSWTLLQEACPGYSAATHQLVGFTDLDGLLLSDILVEQIPFSVRTGNILKNNGISTLGQCAKMEASRARDFRGMGTQSYQEILNQIQTRARVVSTSEVETRSAQSARLLAQMEENGIPSGWLSLETLEEMAQLPVRDTWEETVSDSAWNLWVLQSTHLKEDIYRRLDNLLYQSGPCTMRQLEDAIPSVFLKNGEVARIIERGLQRGRLETTFQGIVLARISLEDWLKTLPERGRDILEQRLEGATLEEIGQKHGLTRERIRQVCRRLLEKRPELKEDRYACWFEEYDLNRQALEDIFSLNLRQCGYLRLTCRPGHKPASEMEQDPRMNAAMYPGYKKYRSRSALMVDGQYVEHKKSSLIAALARSLADGKDIHLQDFYDAYCAVLKESGQEDNGRLSFPNLRAFEARVIDNPKVVAKYGKKIRYYPTPEMDVQELVSQLHLEQFRDLEISTRKLFRLYPQLMEEYDIRDEYELHNILSKTASSWQDLLDFPVRFGRMPCLLIGEANRQKQVTDLLFASAPITQDDFADLYEQEYGMQAMTVRANMLGPIEKYYYQKAYRVDQPVLEPEELRTLAARMDQDLYFLEDARQIVLDFSGEDRAECFNPRTCKELGFKVFSQVLLRNSWPSLEVYFRTLFQNQDSFSLQDMDSRLVYVQIANQVLDELRHSLELLELNDRTFVSWKEFSRRYPQVSRQDLQQTASRAVSWSEDIYYTAHSLLREGFDMSQAGLERPEFLSGLIRALTGSRILRTGGTLLFSRKNRAFTTLDFMRFLLEKHGSMSVHQLLETGREEYGLNLRRDKLLQLMKDSEIYLDPDGILHSSRDDYILHHTH